MSPAVLLIVHSEPDVAFVGVQDERAFAQTQRICTQVHALELGMWNVYSVRADACD